MKTIKLLLLFCCCSSVLSAQCPSAGDPYVGAPFAAVDRYISRSLFGQYLTDYAQSAPGRYNDFINMAVDLYASHIARAAGVWGNESKMNAGSSYYQDATNTVLQTYAAFDCAGKRRPIMEAAILEYISPDVNNVPIFNGLVQHFYAVDPDFPAFWQSNGPYFHFDYNLMRHVTNGGNDRLDLSRPMARMWVYYLAQLYLVAGYRSLHMGAFDDISDNDPGYAKISLLYNDIRNYASAMYSPLMQDANFVYINADCNRPIYVGNSNNYLFDFITTPIRPEDSHNAYSGLPCDGNMNTEFAFGTYLPDHTVTTGGYSPLGYWYDKIPVLFNLDWNSWTSNAGSYGVDMGYHPWGYDEMGWFNNLSDDCKAYWLNSVSYAIKNDVIYRGYFRLPGLEVFNTSLPFITGEFAMADHPTIVDKMKQTWHVDENDLYFTYTRSCSYIPGCPQPNLSKVTVLKVTNPDATSIYTWHIQAPNGSWLPHTYGNTRYLYGLQDGTYAVYLRKDNAAMPSTDVKTLMKMVTVSNYGPAICQIAPTVTAWSYGKKEAVQVPEGMPVLNTDSLETSVDKTELFKIFPNPSKGEFQVQLGREITNGTISVINGYGAQVYSRIIASSKTFDGTLNLGDLPSGTYYVQITQNGKPEFTSKIVVKK